MKIEELKKRYGEEYPAAVICEGARMPLQRESRFARHYHSEERKMGTRISGFMDGSASVTVEELRNDWSSWTERERNDFCQESCWLHEQSDFPDMLRFIMANGRPGDWSGIALSVGSCLPKDEAFELLLRALQATDLGSTSNLTQGIALTKHPSAESTLRRHLQSIWSKPALWDDDKFLNWLAFDATTCISHLIELGASVPDLEEQVRQLAQHTCSHNRDSCRNFLSKYYSWLK